MYCGQDFRWHVILMHDVTQSQDQTGWVCFPLLSTGRKYGKYLGKTLDIINGFLFIDRNPSRHLILHLSGGSHYKTISFLDRLWTLRKTDAQ